jgi:hypothetical protein
VSEKTGQKPIEDPQAEGKRVQESLGIEDNTKVTIEVVDGAIQVLFDRPLTPMQLYAIVRGGLGAVTQVLEDMMQTTDSQNLH